MKKHISVAGILKHNNKILIVRRSNEEEIFPGYYEFPGGSIEIGETPEEALKREYMEEVNLKIKIIDILRVFSYTFKDKEIIELVYTVSLDDDPKNARLSNEHDDLQWITKEEIEKYDLSEEILKSIKKNS